MGKKIEFYKYHGTGNDFILINAMQNNIQLSQSEIEILCHRRFGIGADGLMILRPKKGFDFDMDFYNSDGYPGSMCGNGGRCIVAFAHDMGVIENETKFWAPDGEHKAVYYSQDKIALKMIDVDHIDKQELGLVLDTGSPHLVILKDSNKKLDVFNEGRTIRYSDAYNKKGINVNFVIPGNKISEIYTYERGVENQTFSCGTGTVAAGIALHKLQKCSSPLTFKTLGGKLTIYFDYLSCDSYRNIWLEGPATKTFSGTYLIK